MKNINNQDDILNTPDNIDDIDTIVDTTPVKTKLSKLDQKQQEVDKRKSKERAKVSNLLHQSDEQIEQIVTRNVTIADLDLNTLFSDIEERKLAKDLAKKYLAEFVPRTVSDKQNLRSVIYLEIIQNRLQKVMNNLSAKSDVAIPLNLVDSIHKNLREIAASKARLGLVGKDKDSQSSDIFKHIQTLKAKFSQWLRENPLTRTMICPACAAPVLLKLRMDRWEPQKHPFFTDRWLVNRHIVKLYLENKITKEDVAEILEVSTDYIEDIIQKVWVHAPAYREIISQYRTMVEVDKTKTTTEPVPE